MLDQTIGHVAGPVVVTALPGCGPSVADDPIEVSEVCGSEGPVRLLNVEVPASNPTGATWGSAVVGERAYVLDACGGNEIELGERELPLVVG